jgi:putative acetyltransferase
MEFQIHENTYLIRLAETGDGPEIRRLIKKILPEFDPAYSGDNGEKDLDNLYEAYYKNKGAFLVIIFRDKIVATLGLRPLPDNCAKLKKMYVDPAHRGNGLAALLVNKVMEIARESGFEKVRLETMTAMTSAIKLYHRLGFENIPAVAASARCDLVMEKKIHPTDDHSNNFLC